MRKQPMQVKGISFCPRKKTWSGSVEFTQTQPNGAEQRVIIDMINFSHDSSLSDAEAREKLIAAAIKANAA